MSYNKLPNIMIEVMESYDFVITLCVTDWLQEIKNLKSQKIYQIYKVWIRGENKTQSSENKYTV